MFKRNKNKHVPYACATCQYPTCHTCAFQHPESKKALRTDATGRLGQKWYCIKDACQEALQNAVCEQKGQQPDNRRATAKPKADKRDGTSRSASLNIDRGARVTLGTRVVKHTCKRGRAAIKTKAVQGWAQSNNVKKRSSEFQPKSWNSGFAPATQTVTLFS